MTLLHLLNHLLLSSERLSEQKVLATGSLSMFELLQKHSTDNIDLQAAIPPSALELEWKETPTPTTPNSMSDLVGKKMARYKFQYLGRFKYEGKIITSSHETFASAVDEKTIQNHAINGEGWVNCTWLVDLLMNATTKPDEFIAWEEHNDNWVLTLRYQSIGKTSTEHQKFVFSNDFTSLHWEHTIAFTS